MTRQAPLQRHVFFEAFYHVTWHCAHNQPLIAADMEPHLHQFIRHYCHDLDGVLVHAVGGTETHVHVALGVDPSLAAAEIVGKLKGASARTMNARFGAGSLQWQRGYGLLTFAKRNLPAITRYVANQKEHHANGTTRASLEECGEVWETIAKRLRGEGER